MADVRRIQVGLQCDSSSSDPDSPGTWKCKMKGGPSFYISKGFGAYLEEMCRNPAGIKPASNRKVQGSEASSDPS